MKRFVLPRQCHPGLREVPPLICTTLSGIIYVVELIVTYDHISLLMEAFVIHFFPYHLLLIPIVILPVRPIGQWRFYKDPPKLPHFGVALSHGFRDLRTKSAI
ncbi:hypothetical protein F4819DRAFT_458857 [Hypoxylon fuscum]|nr:hypothetical protein F4819DRAFT_458857 [Hypoxylon fuscum]